jgi:hypothetical protein
MFLEACVTASSDNDFVQADEELRAPAEITVAVIQGIESEKFASNVYFKAGISLK